MELHNFYTEYTEKQGFKHLVEENEKKISIKNLSGSSKAMFAAKLFQDVNANLICIFDDRESAAYFYNDLNKILPDKSGKFFPSSYKRSVQYRQDDPENVVLRTEVLDALLSEKNNLIITYPEAIIEKVISKSCLEENILRLRKGEDLSIDFISDILYEYDFERVDFVYEPGQFSIRGSIVDIYSFSNDDPYRVDFFGNEVESIRTFDIENQLSKEQFDSITIVPNIQQIESKESRISFFDYIDDRTKILARDTMYALDRVQSIYENTTYEEDIQKDDFIIDSNSLRTSLDTRILVEFGDSHAFSFDKVVEFNTSPQPAFNKKFELLAQNLQEKIADGYKVYILSDQEKQIKRLETIFDDINREIKFTPVINTLHEGFIDHDNKICAFTDHQIFDRYHKFSLKTNHHKKGTITLKELNNLEPGDYVVHIDHGIGKFAGLQKLDVNGKTQEVIRLIYRDNDVLFVNIHSLHKISKYKSKDGAPPKIYKLGTGAWQKLKNSTKKKVKDIAKELIALYAKRKLEKGYAFSADNYLQQELEASFLYEDTPDQEKATVAVKTDMESGIPMDRLVCGDVGFGKTEVAMRAAFKAVNDSKQVAVLVPTTILALQHYNTFKERFSDFPVNIGYISRLRRTSQINQTLKDCKEGKIDILIGTHRLVSKDVEFKDLGLLIVDEEQKFGVSVKEKLKRLKASVDTLTLTATPIPRTLQFSLMGARDLSIIQTPPPNRHPIVTEVHTFNQEIIKEAIEYEFDRNGQIFFINNRIQNIFEIETLIKRLMPDVRTVVAHGQMEGPKLEKIMLDFINYEYDVLIATTIIESGLDIPNANTIIINNAQNFGLSELHQLRGRVGRSNKKAFCYLLAPPDESLSQEAKRRLRAIEEFSELGSGFNIAMQDLDIRGAGNLLGGEQSGFIADIGFETYHRILDEAILELKHEDFKDLYAEETEVEKNSDGVEFVNDCHLDTDLELVIPEGYVSNISERIRLYREIDNMKTTEEIDIFKANLKDRFGELPKETIDLLKAVKLRWLLKKLGIEKVTIKNSKLIAYFVSNQNSLFYQSPQFMQTIAHITQHPKLFKLKETKEKLYLSIDNIESISKTEEIFSNFPQNN